MVTGIDDSQRQRVDETIPNARALTRSRHSSRAARRESRDTPENRGTTWLTAALDSPGEYFIDEATQTMYLWMPDSGPPASVQVKVKDFCAQGAVHLSDVAFWGCTFHLQGNGLRVHNVSLQYPSYHKTIDPRDVIPGAKNGCQFHFLSMFSKLLANHRSFTCMKNSWFEMQACLLLSHQDRSLLRRFSRGTMA